MQEDRRAAFRSGRTTIPADNVNRYWSDGVATSVVCTEGGIDQYIPSSFASLQADQLFSRSSYGLRSGILRVDPLQRMLPGPLNEKACRVCLAYRFRIVRNMQTCH